MQYKLQPDGDIDNLLYAHRYRTRRSIVTISAPLVLYNRRKEKTTWIPHKKTPSLEIVLNYDKNTFIPKKSEATFHYNTRDNTFI